MKELDANERLKAIRELLKVRRPDEEQTAELQNHIEALDRWISSGGFLPADWAAKQDIAPRTVMAAVGRYPRIK